jgi:hypothetical protein
MLVWLALIASERPQQLAGCGAMVRLEAEAEKAMYLAYQVVEDLGICVLTYLLSLNCLIRSSLRRKINAKDKPRLHT